MDFIFETLFKHQCHFVRPEQLLSAVSSPFPPLWSGAPVPGVDPHSHALFEMEMWGRGPGRAAKCRSWGAGGGGGGGPAGRAGGALPLGTALGPAGGGGRRSLPGHSRWPSHRDRLSSTWSLGDRDSRNHLNCSWSFSNSSIYSRALTLGGKGADQLKGPVLLFLFADFRGSEYHISMAFSFRWFLALREHKAWLILWK